MYPGFESSIGRILNGMAFVLAAIVQEVSPPTP